MSMTAAGVEQLGQIGGSITIDTRPAQSAASAMQRVGRDIEQSMEGAQGSLSDYNDELIRLDNRVVMLSRRAHQLVNIGLSAARSFEEARASVMGMAGSLDEANRRMEDARRLSAQLKLPIDDVRSAYEDVGGTIGDSIDQMETFLDLSRRLGMAPGQSIASAQAALGPIVRSGGRSFDMADIEGFAIQFGMIPDQLQRAALESGNLFVALDQVLNSMGRTSDVAQELGTTFAGSVEILRDQINGLLAEGFQPLLEGITPVIQGTTDWLAAIQELAPGLARVITSTSLLVASIPVVSVLFNQIAQFAQRLRGMGLGRALGAVGRLGVGAGIAVGGAALAFQGVRAYGRATGNEELANLTIRQAVEALARGVSDVIGVLQDTFFRAKAIILEGVNAWRLVFVNLTEWIDNILPGNLGQRAGMPTPDERRQAIALEASEASHEIAVEREIADVRRLKALRNTLQFISDFVDEVDAGAGGAGSPAAMELQIGQDRTDIITDWATQIRNLEQQVAQDRIDATRQYEMQRTQVIRQFGITMAREEEDWQRRRARAQAWMQSVIDDIREDAARREANWWEAYHERIADIREDSAERIADIEDDYHRRRERAERSHRDTILEAAARLDAKAIAEEQRRFRRQTEDMEDDFQDRVRSEREELQERIEQEQEAHQERLEAAREADDERLRDLQEHFRQRQAEEEEDRRIRLERQREDHAEQLRQLADSHNERLIQIQQNAVLERTAINQELQRRLDDHGEYNRAWKDAQDAWEEASLRSFGEWWDSINQTFRPPRGGGPRPGTQPEILPYQSGGPVPYTGLAQVHGSQTRPEYMLSADTTAMLRGMMGGSFDQAQLVSAVAGGQGATLNMDAGAIVVNAAPGWDPGDVAVAVRMEMIGVFRELAQ